METLSHKFIAALAPPRDHLYSLALTSAGTPAAAESLLTQSARETFKKFAADAVFDIPSAFEAGLTSLSKKDAPPQTPPKSEAMPADVWARLAATIQLEAASSANTSALNPDSVLLKPDPLLAPKKFRQRHTAPEEFNVSTPKRLLALILYTLVVGIVITIYVLTRQSPRPTGTGAGRPSTAPIIQPTIQSSPATRGAP